MTLASNLVVVLLDTLGVMLLVQLLTVLHSKLVFKLGTKVVTSCVKVAMSSVKLVNGLLNLLLHLNSGKKSSLNLKQWILCRISG